MSETTTQHPERRAGQRWRHEWDKLEFVLSKPLGLSTTGKEQWESTAGRIWYFGKGELTSLTLLSDVPAAAPLAAVCKAPEWCDFDDAPDSKDPRIQVYVKAKDGNYGVRRGHRIYCSETCAPPLAAQPAETKRPEVLATVGGKCPLCGTAVPFDHIHVCGGSLRKPAPQPAPACAYGCSDTQANTACPTHGKPAPAKPACERGANLHGGPVLLRCTGKGLFRKLCEHCYLAIEPLQKGPCGDVLHESDVPERIERPKLSHSYGVECPALENA
jgi:hypothetical protein